MGKPGQRNFSAMWRESSALICSNFQLEVASVIRSTSCVAKCRGFSIPYTNHHLPHIARGFPVVCIGFIEGCWQEQSHHKPLESAQSSHLVWCLLLSLNRRAANSLALCLAVRGGKSVVV